MDSNENNNTQKVFDEELEINSIFVEDSRR